MAKGLSARCSLSLHEILLLLIPSALFVASGSIYYSLQKMFEDELVIQVVLCLLFKNSLFFPTKSSSLLSSPISGLSVGIFCVFYMIQSFGCALGGSAASEHFTHLHRNAISSFLDATRYSTQRNASQPLLRAAKLRCECSHRTTSEISTLGSVVSADFLARFVSPHYL